MKFFRDKAEKDIFWAEFSLWVYLLKRLAFVAILVFFLYRILSYCMIAPN
jgi:hypothetical protein